jgi:hypothetical protein
MSIKSINEPEGPGRTTMILPASINEPPTAENIPDDAIPEPVITGLSPDNCTIGDDSFTLYVSGSKFWTNSIIVFADHDEPTTIVDDNTLSTIVNMDVWLGPDTVGVAVRNGEKLSNELNFTFMEAVEPVGKKAKSKR